MYIGYWTLNKYYYYYYAKYEPERSRFTGDVCIIPTNNVILQCEKQGQVELEHILGGTIMRQTTPANRDHLYPNSLLFISVGFLPPVNSQQLNRSSLRPQNHYDDDRTGPNPTPAHSDGGRCTSKSRSYSQVPMFCIYQKRNSR